MLGASFRASNGWTAQTIQIMTRLANGRKLYIN